MLALVPVVVVVGGAWLVVMLAGGLCWVGVGVQLFWAWDGKGCRVNSFKGRNDPAN